jgi:hypothetical protein
MFKEIYKQLFFRSVDHIFEYLNLHVVGNNVYSYKHEYLIGYKN